MTLSINDEFVNVTVIRDDLMPLQRFNITLMEVAQNRQRGEILLHTLQIVIPGQKGGNSCVHLCVCVCVCVCMHVCMHVCVVCFVVHLSKAIACGSQSIVYLFSLTILSFLSSSLFPSLSLPSPLLLLTLPPTSLTPSVPPSAVSLQISLTESQYTVMESASSLAVCVVAVNSLSPSTLSNLTQSATVNVSDMPGSASRCESMNCYSSLTEEATKLWGGGIGKEWWYGGQRENGSRGGRGNRELVGIYILEKVSFVHCCLEIVMLYRTGMRTKCII